MGGVTSSGCISVAMVHIVVHKDDGGYSSRGTIGVQEWRLWWSQLCAKIGRGLKQRESLLECRTERKEAEGCGRCRERNFWSIKEGVGGKGLWVRQGLGVSGFSSPSSFFFLG